MIQDQPKNGHVCRKCWMKVEMWNSFYARIEQIQGIYYKTDPIDQIKCDLPACTAAPDPNMSDDESRLPESSAEDGFDDISVHNYSDGILMAYNKCKLFTLFISQSFFLYKNVHTDFDDQKEIDLPEIKQETIIVKKSKEHRSQRKNKPKQIKEKSYR